MRVNARIGYAVRALVELSGSSRSSPRKLQDLAAAQQIPAAFLADILTMLRHADLVSSQRGSDGGYWLARPPVEIQLAAVIAAVDGPFMEVPPMRPGVSCAGTGPGVPSEPPTSHSLTRAFPPTQAVLPPPVGAAGAPRPTRKGRAGRTPDPCDPRDPQEVM